MALDSVFDTFFNVPTFVLCLGVYLITYIVRTIVETYWANSKDSKFWNHIFLPLGAIVNGAALAWAAKMFPWPLAIGESGLGRTMYGAICGMFSGFMYNRVKSWIKNNTGTSVTISPPAPDAVPGDGPPDSPEQK